jgi:hypothetical protein
MLSTSFANSLCRHAMADLLVEGDELVLHLTRFEKVEGVHGDLRFPLTSITSVEVLEDAIYEVHGWRVGTGIPGVVDVGTFTSPDAKTFAVVHHNTPRGIRVCMQGTTFDQLIVGCQNPEDVATKLNHSRSS